MFQILVWSMSPQWKRVFVRDGVNVLTLIGMPEKYSVFGKGSYVRKETAWQIEICISRGRAYACPFMMYYSDAQKFVGARRNLSSPMKIYGKRRFAILIADHVEKGPKG